MTSYSPKSKILFISTYPPKKCGIATFTQDLTNAVQMKIPEGVEIQVCALDIKESNTFYGPPVSMVMDGHSLGSCLETAAEINNDPFIKLVCIEHEFGLYGGDMGNYLLGFLSILEKPFIIRMHTVLPRPGQKMLNIVQAIGLLADKVIVMTKHSAKLLKEDFRLPPDKIIIIPHGTHEPCNIDATALKLKYNLANKQVLTTFGLLSPNKGIEKGILAMKEISASMPDAIYMVLGQTHPNLLENEGEKYRDYLQRLIKLIGLEQNVKLVNEYVPTNKLMEYLALTDIYLFTSKDPDQAVSGTFLYAMSAGCAIISNSFVLAKEMMDETTGVILTPGENNELAENAIRILKDPRLKEEMSQNAFLKTRNTTWERVAQKHVNLFNIILGTLPIPHASLTTI